MLLEIAIGDAYGAGYEYADPSFVDDNNDLSGYHKHPRHDIEPGCYTDDTQMSLALAELIIDDKLWTEETIANYFVAAFKRDPRSGYAQGFHKFLQNIQDGREFLEKIRPHSDKSGAAMRATPAGIYGTVDEVIAKTAQQASLTHNTNDGIRAAVASALAAHYFLYNLGPKAQLGEFIEENVTGAWNESWTGKVGSKGWMSVRAAITALKESNTLSELLKRSVDFTGDVDTVAAIALGAGSNSDEIENDLPENLHRDFENGTYGYDYIKDLDQKLLSKLGD